MMPPPASWVVMHFEGNVHLLGEGEDRRSFVVENGHATSTSGILDVRWWSAQGTSSHDDKWHIEVRNRAESSWALPTATVSYTRLRMYQIIENMGVPVRHLDHGISALLERADADRLRMHRSGVSL